MWRISFIGQRSGLYVPGRYRTGALDCRSCPLFVIKGSLDSLCSCVFWAASVGRWGFEKNCIMAKLGKASCLLLFVLLFASCSRPVPDSGKDVPILPSVGLKRSFSISTDVEVGSKAPIYAGDPMPLYFLRVDESAVGEGDFWDQLIDAGAAENPILVEAPDYTASTEMMPIHFNPPQVYQRDGFSARMMGWYPQTDWFYEEPRRQDPFLYLEWVIDGSQDIMVSNMQEGNKENRNIMEFTFQHCLTQIQFYVKAESSVASAYWGKLTHIEMQQEPNVFDFMLSDMVDGYMPEECFFAATDKTGILLTGILQSTGIPDGGITIPHGDSLFAGCVMRGAFVDEYNEEPNNTISNIRLTTSNRGVYTFPDNANVPELDPSFCEPGVATKVILNFKAGAVEITLEPAEWRDVDVDVALGAETYPFQTPGTNYIISRDVYGSAMDKWEIRDEKWETSPVSELETSVPAKMEVDDADVSGSMAKSAGDALCPEGWRLPTITELSLMYPFAATLNAPLQGLYRSATQNAQGEVYYWDMDSGTRNTLPAGREGQYRLRCIRDI